MIAQTTRSLPHGIDLSCRSCGPADGQLLVFLHGFPEAAFAWDDVMQHFSQPANGGYRCVAPNLRGYERSSAPAEASAYRAKHLVQDVAALIKAESEATGRPLAALVAHDWGGAVAWGLGPGRTVPGAAAAADHHQLAPPSHILARTEALGTTTGSQCVHELPGQARRPGLAGGE